MKKKEKIIIATLGIASIFGSAFAVDTPNISSNNSTNITTTDLSIGNWKEFKNKIRSLRTELKNSTTKEERQAIREKIFYLFQNYQQNHPGVLPRYTHKLFHHTERNEVFSKIKDEKKLFRQTLKNSNKKTWETLKGERKNIRKAIQKETKQKIREISKQYIQKINQLKTEIKGKTKEEKQAIIKQIINLKIEKMETIKNILPEGQKKQMENIINNYKTHIKNKQNEINNFKEKIVNEKKGIYTNLSKEIFTKIDNGINKLKEKINSLSSEKGQKLLNRTKKIIAKIIDNHYKNTKNQNTLHFQNEITILKYLQSKLNEIKISNN